MTAVVACSGKPRELANAVPPPARPTQRVVFYEADGQAWAVVLGCGRGRGDLDGNTEHCLALVDRTITANNRAGHGFTVGEHDTQACRSGVGNADGVKVASPVSDKDSTDHVQGKSEIFVWPARDADRLVLPTDDVLGFDATAAAVVLQRKLGDYSDAFSPPTVGHVVAKAMLRADLDGDGSLDDIYSIEGDDAEDAISLNGIVAKLSSRGDYVLLQASSYYWSIVGAIDLDDDGKAELIVHRMMAADEMTYMISYRDGVVTPLRTESGFCYSEL